MVTRRTLRRTHLLRPDAELNALFTYCLAVVAERYGIRVHAAVVMSTHEHLILTDVQGVLPRFLQELHRLVALGVKVLRKWEGAVWDHEKSSVVELRTDQAVIEKLAYAMANPVAAGLIRDASDWPGVTTRPHELGLASWKAARPAGYFDADNPQWPDVATLALTMPQLSMSDADSRQAVAAELKAQEAEARAHLRAKGWHFLKRVRLRTLSPFTRARSREPLRARNPTFAVGRGQRAAFLAAVAAVRAFREAYRAALQSWRSKLRAALFPPETWLMRWLHGAAIGAEDATLALTRLPA